MNTKLSPCPFCNTPAEYLIEESTAASEIRGETYQGCWIECATCGAQGPHIEVSSNTEEEYNSYEDVRIAWNSRVNL